MEVDGEVFLDGDCYIGFYDVSPSKINFDEAGRNISELYVDGSGESKWNGGLGFKLSKSLGVLRQDGDKCWRSNRARVCIQSYADKFESIAHSNSESQKIDKDSEEWQKYQESLRAAQLEREQRAAEEEERRQQRLAAEETERKRLAEEDAKRQARAVQQRREVEKQQLADAEAKRQRLADYAVVLDADTDLYLYSALQLKDLASKRGQTIFIEEVYVFFVQDESWINGGNLTIVNDDSLGSVGRVTCVLSPEDGDNFMEKPHKGIYSISGVLDQFSRRSGIKIFPCKAELRAG
ncbi:hypothetical protein [Aliiroseovarius sp. PrR006]|uniref:hypothetical protein n=1 Tax=Aliiroseovarius sp. PrR006 TaxID=2706883 RepID=UPI0013D805B4|nr:hypothetical protein [Aliiroseovarius sp. PrR006]NDW53617.1 hypothetical protein [Aliiroseovarius sp. PrR006]